MKLIFDKADAEDVASDIEAGGYRWAQDWLTLHDAATKMRAFLKHSAECEVTRIKYWDAKGPPPRCDCGLDRLLKEIGEQK